MRPFRIQVCSRLASGVSSGWSDGLNGACRQSRAPSQSKNGSPSQIRSEASTGFEPVMRVLQTLALPLGHDAVAIS